MEQKYYLKSEGTLVKDQGDWVTATAYAIGDFVTNDDIGYFCEVAHTSGASTEPGTGGDWETVWRGFAKGEKGDTGDTGVGSYGYVAYASDASGTGFSLTPGEGLDYVAFLLSDVVLDPPVVGDFAGLWKLYKGDQGDPGTMCEMRGSWSDAVTYAKYDGVLSVEGRGCWSRQNGNLNHAPPNYPTTYNDWWYVFAEKGVDGEGTGDVIAPATTTENKYPKWSVTQKTLVDGTLAGAASGNLVIRPGTNQVGADEVVEVTGTVGVTIEQTLLKDGYEDLAQIAAPGAAASGKTRVYTKADGKIYSHPYGGAETELGAGGGSNIGRDQLRPATLGYTPATLAADKDLSGRVHLVYPTDEALELVGGMECVGNTDGSTVKLYFRASSDDDTIFRAATNKAFRVEIEYYDGAGGGSAAITGVTNATPCVVTSNGHGLENGQFVYITGLVGPAALNGKLWKVANKGTNTFELEGSTASGAYSSGGTWFKGCIVASMYNATPAAVRTPLAVLQNSGKWKTARCIADITARCNGDYTGQGNADLCLEGDVSGLDLYIRAVRLRQVTNEAAIVWIADSGRPHPVSSPMIRKEASTKLTYLTYTYSSARAVTVTSFADVDATNLSLPFETEGGLCEVKAAFSGHSPANKALYFDLAVDGVRVGGSSGSGLVYSGTVDSALAIVFVAPIVLSPGAHVLTLQSKVEADTGYVSASVPVYLSVLELKN